MKKKFKQVTEVKAKFEFANASYTRIRHHSPFAVTRNRDTTAECPQFTAVSAANRIKSAKNVSSV